MIWDSGISPQIFGVDSWSPLHGKSAFEVAFWGCNKDTIAQCLLEPPNQILWVRQEEAKRNWRGTEEEVRWRKKWYKTAWQSWSRESVLSHVPLTHEWVLGPFTDARYALLWPIKQNKNGVSCDFPGRWSSTSSESWGCRWGTGEEHLGAGVMGAL